MVGPPQQVVPKSRVHFEKGSYLLQLSWSPPLPLALDSGGTPPTPSPSSEVVTGSLGASLAVAPTAPPRTKEATVLGFDLPVLGPTISEGTPFSACRARKTADLLLAASRAQHSQCSVNINS